MPLVEGGVRLTWKLPVEGIRGAEVIGVGLPPLEGGTTISAIPTIGPHENMEELTFEAHAVEDDG